METRLHVIFGTGPVGCWTARSLVDRGLPVRAVNRSGARPGLLPEEVELVKADVADPAQAVAAAEGATVVYQALNPPYHQWEELFPALQAGALAAARAAGARYVSIENLYLYDSSAVMTEDSRVAPASKKGELRRRMAEEVAAAHRDGAVRATQLRSSDYYGPGVTGSALGDRVFPPLIAGKKAQVGRLRDAAALVRLHRGRRQGGGRARRPRRGARPCLVRAARSGRHPGRHGRAGVPASWAASRRSRWSRRR